MLGAEHSRCTIIFVVLVEKSNLIISMPSTLSKNDLLILKHTHLCI